MDGPSFLAHLVVSAALLLLAVLNFLVDAWVGPGWGV